MNETLLKALADITKKAMGDLLAPVIKRVESLENSRQEFEILPAIDLEKSYARGIYAMHNGGLWKSYQKTNGIRGWDCLVNGVASVSVEPVSEREFSIKAALSDGQETVHRLTVPTMIYKGVFNADTDYQPGDVVTQGGSMWSCHTATKEKPVNGCADWTLCVKHGRDGRVSS